LERELQTVGEGLPAGADDAALEPIAAEAEAYEAEFVLPVSEAEARAARAAAEEAEEAAAAEAEGREEEERAAAEAAAKAKAAKKGKKGGGGAKGKKGGGGKGGKGGGGKGGGAAAESEWGAEDEGQQLGPKLLLGSGRVRRKVPGGSAPQQEGAAAGVKAEAMDVDGGGGAGGGQRQAGVKQESGGVKAEGGEEDVRKLVAPLEELDDSGAGVKFGP
jgi:hypothetical protein